jgi:excisionase family DNA binding protein
MENTIILQGLRLETFFQEVEAIVARQVEAKLADLKKSKPNTLMTRKEAANLLKVSLPTISQWTKHGLLTSYRMGKRVFYKSLELDEALVKRRFR